MTSIQTLLDNMSTPLHTEQVAQRYAVENIRILVCLHYRYEEAVHFRSILRVQGILGITC